MRLKYDIEVANFKNKLSFIFFVTNEIKIEKRQVLSLMSLFGEIGGLYEVLATCSIFLLSIVRIDKLRFEMIAKLFHVSKNLEYKTKTPSNLLERA